MPSLTTARRDLLRALGGDASGVYLSTGVGTTSTIISTQFKSTLYPADYLAGCWVFVPAATAPRQRRVPLVAGLAPGSGTITLDDVLGSAIGSGVEFEVCSRMSLVDETSGAAGLGGSSLTACLNLATQHLLVPETETLALVSGQSDYSTAAWPYLDRTERLTGVRQLDASGGTRIPTPRTWELRGDLDDQGFGIHFDAPFVFTGSQSAYLVTLRPADQKIKVGGTWTQVANGRGLVAETDEAACDLTHLTTAALVFAYRALSTRTGPSGTAYRERYTEQLAAARALKYWDTTRDRLEPRPPAGQTGAPS